MVSSPAARRPPDFWIPGTPSSCSSRRLLFGAIITAVQSTTAEAAAVASADTLTALDTLEARFKECSGSGGSAFFAGDAPGYVDVALGGFIAWLRAWDKVAGVKLLDGGRTPLLAEWAERLAALDAAKGVFPDPDRIAGFAKALQARVAAAAGSK